MVDPDHPQNFLGRVRIFDPQSLLNPRPERFTESVTITFPTFVWEGILIKLGELDPTFGDFIINGDLGDISVFEEALTEALTEKVAMQEENKKLAPLRDKKMESAAKLQKLNLDMLKYYQILLRIYPRASGQR